MKESDIQKLYEAGLITEDQRRRILDHFNLELGHNKFLAILVGIGGVLALAGIVLVISANWASIPRLVKLASGVMLLTGSHILGWHLSGTRQTHPKLGEVFHFLGAGLFLANIALVGQVYNLSSRTPDALLFWLAGIIPLAWLLRSRLIHALSLAGLIAWLGTEINSADGWLYFASSGAQMAIYGGLGLLYYGSGLALSSTRFRELGPVTTHLGLLMVHVTLWGIVIGFYSHSIEHVGLITGVAGALAIAGAALALIYLQTLSELSRQWRIIWSGVVVAWAVLLFTWPWALSTGVVHFELGRRFSAFQALASLVVIAGCMLQIRAAIEMRAVWMVNLAIVSIAFVIIADFLMLIGSMLNTGLIFLVGGAGLLGLGFLLERKRRAVLRQIKL